MTTTASITSSEHDSDIKAHATSIETAMTALLELLMAPTADMFRCHHTELLRVLRMLGKTDTLYASFAYAAHQAGASRSVGTVRTSTYLARVLDVSEYQARQWLTLGMRLFDEPAPPQPDTFTTSDTDSDQAGIEHAPKDSNEVGDDESSSQQRLDELAQRRAAHEHHQRQLAAQAHARKQTRALNNAKMTEINRELEHLDPSLRADHHQPLLARATNKAATTTVEDLKIWLRAEIRGLNSTVVDPLADMRARKVIWSPPDKRGNVRLTAVLPRTGHALVETLLAPARLAAFERSRGIDTDHDRRTLPQRRADAFMAMLTTLADMGDKALTSHRRGLASLVVAVSAKDLQSLPNVANSVPNLDGAYESASADNNHSSARPHNNTTVNDNSGAYRGKDRAGEPSSGDSRCDTSPLSAQSQSEPRPQSQSQPQSQPQPQPRSQAQSRSQPQSQQKASADSATPGPTQGVWFPTNTSAWLHPLDILRLGLAEHDLGVVMDPTTGRAVGSARMRRHASVEQKLMLVAEQLCCAFPGCNRPAVECDVHHLLAWSRGGRTDIENLTLLCRQHHRMNRDQHDGALGMGHAQVDPESGRVGWREPRRDCHTIPQLPGAPTSLAALHTPSRTKPRSHQQAHPGLSDTVVVNQSTTARQAPGARITQQEWSNSDIAKLF